MLNALIAMFSNTYQQVHEDAILSWHWNRYNTILEGYHALPGGTIVAGLTQIGLFLIYLITLFGRTFAYIFVWKWAQHPSTDHEHSDGKRPSYLTKVLFNKRLKYV